MYKVRFNLGRGTKFMKWKVTNIEDNTSRYIDPLEYNISMFNAQLKNSKTTASKINAGSNKTVCAWIVCETIVITDASKTNNGFLKQFDQIRYNPRVKPFWMLNGTDIDGERFKTLETLGRDIFTPAKN